MMIFLWALRLAGGGFWTIWGQQLASLNLLGQEVGMMQVRTLVWAIQIKKLVLLVL